MFDGFCSFETSSGDTSDAPSNTDCPEDTVLDDDDMPMSQPVSTPWFRFSFNIGIIKF